MVIATFLERMRCTLPWNKKLKVMSRGIKMKKLGIVTVIGAVVMGVNIPSVAGAHAQGGTLTVPIITQTFVEDFNPYSGAQAEIGRAHV